MTSPSQPAGMGRRLVLLCAALAVAGAALRAGAVYAVPKIHEQYVEAVRGESTDPYVRIANSILAGRGYYDDHEHNPGSYRTYFVPFVWTAYLFLSRGNLAVLVVLRLLEFGVGAYVLSRSTHVLFHRPAAVAVALALYCFNPYFLALGTMPGETEIVTIVCLWTMAESALLWRQPHPRLRAGALWGLAAGLLYLSRAELIVGPFLFALAFGVRAAVVRDARRLTALVAGGVIVAAAAASWVGRNHYLYGELILTRDDSLICMFVAHNSELEKVYPEFSQDCMVQLVPFVFDQFSRPGEGLPPQRGRFPRTYGVPEKFRNPLAFQRAIHAFYAENPSKIPALALRKLLWALDPRYVPIYSDYRPVEVDAQGHLFWNPADVVPRPLSQRISHLVLWPLVMLGTAAGLVLFRRTHPAVVVSCLCMVIGYLVMAVVALPTTRNRLPVEVACYPLAAAAAAWAWERLRLRRPRREES